MADIVVKELVTHVASGSDLFDDSESFMLEINEGSEGVMGGLRPIGIPCISRIGTLQPICPYGGESVSVKS